MAIWFDSFDSLNELIINGVLMIIPKNLENILNRERTEIMIIWY